MRSPRSPRPDRPALRLRSLQGRSRWLGLVVGLAVTLSACGSDSSDPPPPPPEGPTRTTLVPDGNSGYIEARTSMVVGDGSPASWVFDDFTLDADATIGTVAWQGIYCIQTVGSSAPTPTASGFTVSFYSDVSGRPAVGSPLQTSTYTLAESNQRFIRNVSGLTCGTATPTEWSFYNYEVDLDASFHATAGTKYWISVQANTPSYAVYFGWRDGTPDNLLSLQLYDGSYTVFDVDRAYSLAP